MVNAPLQPPEPVQAVALVELQVSVDALPEATTVGLAVNAAVGGLGGGSGGEVPVPLPHAASSSALPIAMTEGTSFTM
ncbi:MAG TPA: hypothetical protein VNZ53_24115 [Steroidobacteraceae bacterium]|nr:hypothetical protein [Steroidobacteraceae bacterium]